VSLAGIELTITDLYLFFDAKRKRKTKVTMEKGSKDMDNDEEAGKG